MPFTWQKYAILRQKCLNIVYRYRTIIPMYVFYTFTKTPSTEFRMVLSLEKEGKGRKEEDN